MMCLLELATFVAKEKWKCLLSPTVVVFVTALGNLAFCVDVSGDPPVLHDLTVESRGSIEEFPEFAVLDGILHGIEDIVLLFLRQLVDLW